MLHIRVLVTLLLMLAIFSFTSECLSQRSTVAELKEKRWHSVKTADQVEDGQERPWLPAVGDPNGPAQVPYCFTDEQAATSLHKQLAKALRKWRPALRPDRVSVIPDSACSSESWCLCSVEGVSPSTLRISLTNSAYGSSGHGYNDKNVNDVRHSLLARPGKDVVSMAHEIGHVLGLVHEHQRPDALQYITFDCEALPTYEEAKQRISKLENHPKLPMTMMPDERMQIVCANPRLAKMYFPEAWHWMPWPRPDKAYTNSRAYDFDSIMHYPSSPKTGPPYALLRHKKDLSPGEPTDPENLIYMGGNKDQKEAGPTQMDIERIKALYPRKRLSAGTQSPSDDTQAGAADDDDENAGSGDEKPGAAANKRQASHARWRALRAMLSLEPDPNDDH